MKLQACENCGVVLDTSKISRPYESQYDLDSSDPNYDELFDKHFAYSGDDYSPTFDCPVCKHQNIFE